MQDHIPGFYSSQDHLKIDQEKSLESRQLARDEIKEVEDLRDLNTQKSIYLNGVVSPPPKS